MRAPQGIWDGIVADLLSGAQLVPFLSARMQITLAAIAKIDTALPGKGGTEPPPNDSPAQR